MNLTSLPREAVKLEYAVLRAPLTLLEHQVVARYFADEAAIRLGFERFLGSLDTAAGRVLSDETLTRRGEALIRRTTMLQTAAELEAKAELREAEADEQLRTRTQNAAGRRRQAEREKNETLAETRRKEQTGVAKARRQTSARASANEQRAAERTARQIEAAERTKNAEQERIAGRGQQVSAAAGAELADAARERASADAKHEQADRLNELAANERQQRQPS